LVEGEELIFHLDAGMRLIESVDERLYDRGRLLAQVGHRDRRGHGRAGHGPEGKAP